MRTTYRSRHPLSAACLLLAALPAGAGCSRDPTPVSAGSTPVETATPSVPAAPVPPAPHGTTETAAPAAAPEEPMVYDALHRLFEVRRSIRQFTADPVDDAAVQRILLSVRLCPTAGNVQAYEVVVVRDPAKRAALAAASGGQPWVQEASVVLAFVARPGAAAERYGSRGADLYAVQDATIATTYAMLAAAALGFGTVWVGAFDTDEVARILECAVGEVPVALLPVGKAAETPPARPRRLLGEMTRRL